MAGTHQDISLVKGTQSEQREFARRFVEFLLSSKVLVRHGKSRSGPGWVLKVSPKHRTVVSEFSQKGLISAEIRPFFDRYLEKST